MQVAEYKRKIDLANNTVGDDLAEKMLLMQKEHTIELRSMREQTNVTMHDVIRNNASMDAEHKEEKQRMQAHFEQLSRNAQEEKTNRNRENKRQVARQRQRNLCTSRNSRKIR